MNDEWLIWYVICDSIYDFIIWFDMNDMFPGYAAMGYGAIVDTFWYGPGVLALYGTIPGPYPISKFKVAVCIDHIGSVPFAISISNKI